MDEKRGRKPYLAAKDIKAVCALPKTVGETAACFGAIRHRISERHRRIRLAKSSAWMRSTMFLSFGSATNVA